MKNIQKLTIEKLQEGCRQARGYKNFTAQECLQELLRRIGPAGEQSLEDEKRYFNEYLETDWNSRKQTAKNAREVSFVHINEDCSAMIVSFVEYGWFCFKGGEPCGGGFRWITEERQFDVNVAGGLHHLRISAYLVVRDSSSNERHIMRIPPRFGSLRSATYKHYTGEAYNRNALIRAALAWTFNIDYAEYQPQLAA
jgi:hypothetical protein